MNDYIIRPDWRWRRVKEWTKAELETANMEMTSHAHACGFNSGDDRQDRTNLAAAATAGFCVPYDCTAGFSPPLGMTDKYVLAAVARDHWARECGFDSFVAAKKFGLAKAGKRHPKYLERIAREGKTNVLGTSAAMGSTESGSTAVTVERSKDDIVQDSDNHGDQSKFSDRQSPQDEFGPPAFPD